MSATDTALVFVGIPAAITLLITVLVFAPGRRSPHRYRPGRPFDFAPVWFLSSPEQLAEPSTKTALPTSAQPPALAGGETEKAGAPAAGTMGGASDRW
ncbi:MAG TPA: hypothetical protein VHN18_15100 [Micromonosporaceae bacterium]|nr:hypothetical protein [Micromonosporaceae bacterium]